MWTDKKRLFSVIDEKILDFPAPFIDCDMPMLATTFLLYIYIHNVNLMLWIQESTNVDMVIEVAICDKSEYSQGISIFEVDLI